jgi:hypothetical protein
MHSETLMDVKLRDIGFLWTENWVARNKSGLLDDLVEVKVKRDATELRRTLSDRFN